MNRNLTSGQKVKMILRPNAFWHKKYNGYTGTYFGYNEMLDVHVVQSEDGVLLTCDDVEPIGKTLLEILVDELPKRGGWRDGASVCIQDSCKAIKFNSRHSTLTMNEFGNWESKPDAFNNYGWVGANLLGVSDLATDHATKIVTREEYEQAVKPTRFEQSVKAANELALVMLENMAQRLTDACAQREEADDFVITAPSDVRYINSTFEIKYPAGYHIPECQMPWLSKCKTPAYSVRNLTQREPEDSIKKGRFTVEVDCTLGALPVHGIKKSSESKLERIERLHDAFKSAKAALDAEFKPIIEIMDDLELGDCFTVNHNKDGLVNFRVIKVISELDGQGQAKDRKLFVKKLSTGDEYALTKEDKSYAVKAS